jgi:hypothetical protein
VTAPVTLFLGDRASDLVLNCRPSAETIQAVLSAGSAGRWTGAGPGQEQAVPADADAGHQGPR